MTILNPLKQMAEAGLTNVDTLKRFTQMVPLQSPIPTRVVRTGYNADQGIAKFFNGGTAHGTDLNSDNLSFTQNGLITEGKVGAS